MTSSKDYMWIPPRETFLNRCELAAVSSRRSEGAASPFPAQPIRVRLVGSNLSALIKVFSVSWPLGVCSLYAPDTFRAAIAGEPH
jgi:hypothetical protein